jgi:tripartite-type tricarboxylate transporter receptor subunit TctC
LVVINKPGAASALGARIVAQSKPDGYTLTNFNISTCILNAINYDTGWDAVKDFEPVCNFISLTNVLVVPSTSKLASVAEYVKAAKSNPDKIISGSSGVGSSQHFSLELFKNAAKVQIAHVPYKGSTPCVMDLLGGHIDSGFINGPDVIQHIKAGKLRALAVTSSKRLSDLPNTPTIAESGYPGFEVKTWIGCAAPAKTPSPIIEKLASAFRRSLEDQEVRKQYFSLMFIPDYMGPEEFKKFIKNEYDKFMEIAKIANIRAPK